MKVIRSIRRIAPSLDDADLVLAARSGEPWARETLLQRHCEASHRLAFLLLGPNGGSRDVIETAFRASFAELAALRAPADFSRTLLRHTVACVQAKLTRARRPFIGERPDFLGFRSQQALVHDEDERRALGIFYESIERLPVEARLAWLLREVESKDLWDIATLLSISKFRARRMVEGAERRLRQLGGPPPVPHSLLAGAADLPVPLSEFERAQLHRRVEQRLAARVERRSWRWAAGAVALSACVGAGVVLLERHGHAAATDATAAPTPQSVELPDGTRALLSAGAELRVNRADAEEVRLALASGRADFDRARSAGERLVVKVGAASVSARGPRLSVSIEEGDVAHRALSVQVTTSGGPAELWRRADAPSIVLGADETWMGRVPLDER